MATQFEADLREQPAVLQRMLGRGRATAESIAEALRGRDLRFAVIAARGSSDNAARYGQYALGIQNRLVAALATPSLFTHYRTPPSLAGALVLAVSQSGQSPDVVEVVREGRRQGAATVALTNDPSSPLAAAAELVFPLEAGHERAVAATKTYTAQVMALAMISAALRGDAELWEDLQRVPGLVQQAIDLAAPVAESRAQSLSAPSRLIVLGRGFNLSTAFEITLKIKETTGIMADGYSSADFVHGPKALLDPHVPVLVVAPGRKFEEMDEIVRLAEEMTSPLIAISDRDEILDLAELPLPLPADVPEWLSPIVAVVPGQLWTLGLSLARGMDPDRPPGLTKVTHTR